ncbi:helix-turn-helix transcriptional regulator [Paenibacillus polymyxa]|uniref:helix-turn-helix domain-containing protein n=1 Tax=Paenibacillus polymyxa TaxID=1406 RepID=UPI002AB3939E|nr:helix-turn-helix transcriptional regulator [Paenibacillus polymyxa]MDY7993354.1 helix-turn-helix transcriptional regulator [Paenibacillus polymyxa]MDY8120045.1 helix-turn-helix transcriptional regulator [Paenibacillus polymyxa]
MDKRLIAMAIKEKRKEMKKRQNEVAVETGLSRNYISDIENGRYMPSVGTLVKIASCLEIDLNTLLMTEIQDKKCVPIE